MTAIDTGDLFAGPGGWSVAAAILGLREVGFELDRWACATRAAAGHLTIRADVAAMPTARMKGRLKGLIASPPCGTFSAAGKGEGVGDLPLLHQGLDDLAAGRDTRAGLAAACSDPRTPLVVEPLRYALDLRPEWIALEQVPAVLPLWQHIARIMRTLGYSAWVGILNATDYGVPQTRKRAILIASRVRTVAPPEPTHYDARKGPQLWGDPWVSMAEALGWAPAGVINTRGERTTPGGNEFPADQPSWALTEKVRSWWVLRSGQSVASEGRAKRGGNEPAVTITGRTDLCSWVPGDSEQPLVRITVEEASILQSFRPDYPWQGSKTAKFLQIGNAVPPRLAAAVIGAATGMDWAAAVGRKYCAPGMDRAA